MKPTMTDINENALTGEGIILWAVFTKDGKASLRMDYEMRPETGYGRLLFPDLPVLYEILMPDDAFRFLSLPGYGISIRIRMRFRYPGTEDSVAMQPENEPEKSFLAWIAKDKAGRIGLYLQDPSTGACPVPDMPGLPELQQDRMPVKVEMLIRQDSEEHDFLRMCGMMKRKTDAGSGLMKEGMLVWLTFMAEDKVAMYLQDRIRFIGDGKYVPGRLLSSDISILHEVYDWDRQYPEFRSTPGVSVRYRIRLRYPGADESAIKRSKYEPEACLPVWLVRNRAGRISLCLHEPYSEYCLIPDMEGLPGLPELEADNAPIRLEMLIRQDHPIFDRIDPAFLKPGRETGIRKKGRRTDGKAGRAGTYEELPSCYAKIFGGEKEGKEDLRFRTEPTVSTPPVHLELPPEAYRIWKGTVCHTGYAHRTHVRPNGACIQRIRSLSARFCICIHKGISYVFHHK